MKRIALWLIGISLGAGFAMQACNGGDDGTTDGSTTDATSGDAPSDVVAADSKPSSDGATFECPSYDGSVPMCQAAVAHCHACGFTGSSCDLANFAGECEGFASFYSTQCQDLFVANATSCDASVSCTFTSLLDAGLTTAQQKTADDYCAECADGGGCVTNIVSNVGLELYGDAVNALIDTACTPDAGTASACNLTQYQLCAFSVAGAQVPKNPCADAGGD